MVDPTENQVFGALNLEYWATCWSKLLCRPYRFFKNLVFSAVSSLGFLLTIRTYYPVVIALKYVTILKRVLP
jgi:hypothetical protein